jgi:hypothetical protein
MGHIVRSTPLPHPPNVQTDNQCYIPEAGGSRLGHNSALINNEDQDLGWRTLHLGT